MRQRIVVRPVAPIDNIVDAVAQDLHDGDDVMESGNPVRNLNSEVSMIMISHDTTKLRLTEL